LFKDNLFSIIILGALVNASERRNNEVYTNLLFNEKINIIASKNKKRNFIVLLKKLILWHKKI
jgi:hypothetical protein